MVRRQSIEHRGDHLARLGVRYAESFEPAVGLGGGDPRCGSLELAGAGAQSR